MIFAVFTSAQVSLGIRHNGKTSFPTQTDIKIAQILQLAGQEIIATNATARWPIHRSNWLYWQGGIGTLNRINLDGNFAPNKIAWASIAKTGSQRGDRPFVAFLPQRITQAELIEGGDLSPVITNDFIPAPPSAIPITPTA